MASESFARRLNSWLPRTRRSGSSSVARKSTLTFTSLEDRSVPATLPAPVVSTFSDGSQHAGVIGTGPFNTLGHITGKGGAPDINFVSSTAAVDPNDPLKQVVFGVRSTTEGGNPLRSIIGISTTDGGESWQEFYDNQFDRFNNPLLDPSNTAAEARALDSTTPSAAFGRGGFVYLVQVQKQDDNSAGFVVFDSFDFSGGFPTQKVTESVLYSWAKNDAAFNPVVAVNNNISSYTDPTSGITLTDSTARGDIVYVAWNTNATQPATPANGAQTVLVPNIVQVRVSSNAGATFGNAISTNDNGYAIRGGNSIGLAESEAAPQIAFAPVGTFDAAGKSLAGQVTFVNSLVNDVTSGGTNQQVGGLVLDNSMPSRLGTDGLPVISETFSGPAQFITNGFDPGSGAHVVGVTTSLIAVNFTNTNLDLVTTGKGSTTPLTDLNVELSLVHPNLDQLLVQLEPPVGLVNPVTKAAVQPIVLLRNRVQPDGNSPAAPAGQFQQGTTGANLGGSPFFNASGLSIFDDQAPRVINDTAHGAPFFGSFRPELNKLSQLNGMSPSDLKGLWTLRMVDNRGDTTFQNQFLEEFKLNFTFGTKQGFGADQLIPSSASFIGGSGLASQFTVQLPNIQPDASEKFVAGQFTAIVPPRGFAETSNVTLASGVTLPAGGPAVSIAYDNSLPTLDKTTGRPVAGLSSGRFYLAMNAYLRQPDAIAKTIDTDIVLFTSDDGAVTFSQNKRVNDDTAFDNFSEGTRPQYMPTVAVDQATGTLAMTWFDARNDASGQRVANYIATSIDGGLTFSPQTYLSPARQAINAINKNEVTNFDPIPSSTATLTAFGLDSTQSLFINKGQIYSYWTGNLNSRGSSTLGAKATTSAGPRIITNDPLFSPDMGPVTGSTTVGQITYNGTLADGTPFIDGFTIFFDRPIDQQTFTADDITVTYTDTTGVQNNVPTLNPVEIVAGGLTPSTGFFVPFRNKMTSVGTYTYKIEPAIQDRLRQQFTRIAPSGPAQTFTPVGGLPLDISETQFQSSNITVPTNAFQPNEQIADISVSLNVSHGRVGDLVVFLQSPAGDFIRLIGSNPFLIGADYGDSTTNLILTDSASKSITQGTPPYLTPTNTYRPEVPLGTFVGSNPAGTWGLFLFDVQTKILGKLNSWSLQITPGTVSGFSFRGNQLDLDGNAIAGENPNGGSENDRFSTPQTANNGANTILPLVIPGPFAVGGAVPGKAVQPANDTVFLNQAASTIEVEFNRPIDPATFTSEDVLRMTGPVGNIAGPFTVAPVAKSDNRRFAVSFPTQTVSGPYSIEFGSEIRTVDGAGLDTNKNAGVAVLLGGDPLTGVIKTNSYASAAPAAAIPANGSVTLSLTVPDLLVIQQDLTRFPASRILTRLNITHPRVQDLTVTLVAPDGSEVQLASGVGSVGQSTANFTDTLFDDAATTPIQLGTAPFTARFNPQFPLANLINTQANGNWSIRVNNSGTSTGTLNSFGITLPYSFSGTGLSEEVADRFQIGFRVHIQDPTNLVTRQQWTPIGPSSLNTREGAGRVTAVTVDPSDPSGNTVYAGGARGGIWKTTNFLTTDPAGPTWIPLLDFGPNTALNSGGLAVFPRNNDPSQSVIFALTGEGDYRNRGLGVVSGVGVLRSLDGGRTWRLLDSVVNTSTPNNSGNSLTDANILPIGSGQRLGEFIGSTGFKIVVDPNLTPTGDIVVYMAISDTNGGIWRSRDSGLTWTRLRAGNATDVVIAAGSIPVNAVSTGNNTSRNAEIVYGAFSGPTGGVFVANPAPTTTTMQLMNGGNGNQLLVDVWPFPTIVIGGREVQIPNTGTPNTDVGRIVLAAPFATNNPGLDSFYRGWLYAFVATPGGQQDGLYVTKDSGRNWTRVQLPVWFPFAGQQYLSNDESRNDTDVLDSNNFPSRGNESIGLAIDPNDPHVVYISGLGGFDFALPTSGSIRVDIRTMSDAQSLVLGDSSDPAAANVEFFASKTGGAEPRIPVTDNQYTEPGLLDPATALLFTYASPGPNNRELQNNFYYNLSRDPNAPFVSNATLQVLNVSKLNNDGGDAKFTPFVDIFSPDDLPVEAHGFVHRVITTIDPISRRTRLIFATDFGLVSGVDDGTGKLLDGLGFAKYGTNSRNGNLQLLMANAGGVQPSQIAADIAGALFYAGGVDYAVPQSSADILATGNLNYAALAGFASSIVPDAGGSGLVYSYRQPGFQGATTGAAQDFFRLMFDSKDPFNGGVGRTNGLLELGDVIIGNSQWQNGNQTVGYFAVNPIDRNGVLIGSTTNVYRSTTAGDPSSGATFFKVAGQGGTPDNITGQPSITAFGSPDPSRPGELNNFLYVGTYQGGLFFTETGNTPWTDSKIDTVSKGAAIEAIVPNPRFGSREVYVVATNGVYHNPDVRNTQGWVNITNNLFSITTSIFGDATQTQLLIRPNSLTSLVADWRYAIPDGTGGTFPVLYAAGFGGVVRSRDRGATWEIYPAMTTDGAAANGGFLPHLDITDLDLSLGNIDPATGLPDQGNGGLNMLVATTRGRGMWAIRLNTALDPTSLVQFEPGPVVTKLANPNPTTGPSKSLTLFWDGPVDPATFTAADVKLLDVNGNPIAVSSVTLTSIPGANGANPRNQFEITFPDQATPGFYRLTVGPNISDLAGNLMNQDKNGVNGQATDIFDRFVFLNGVDNNLVVDILPQTVNAGTVASFVVSATTKDGTVITGFDRTVRFTFSDPSAATLPDYTFVATDKGSRQFDVTFKTAGTQAVRVDLVNPGLSPLNPAKDVVIVNPGPVNQFTVSGYPSTIQAGTKASFTVAAADAFGNLVSDYTGTVRLSSTDAQAAFVPATYTFALADGGKRILDGTLKTAGTQSITATDTSNANVVGSQQNIVVTPAEAKAISIDGLPNPYNAGNTETIFVSIRDDFGNIVPTFLGTVDLTSTDQFAKLPNQLTFGASDQGKQAVAIQLRIPGTTKVTAVDANSTLAQDQESTTVSPAAVARFEVKGYSDPTIAGVASNFTVTAIAPDNTVAVGYLGTVSFSSNDTKAGLPANYTFTIDDNGSRIFSGNLKTAGEQSITVTDVVTTTVLGKQTDITVLPNVLSTIAISGYPSPVVAGSANNFTVTATDAFGNLATGYTGTVTFTSSDNLAGLPAAYTFTAADNGVKSFTASLKTAGTHSITATDLAQKGVTSTQSGIVVTPAGASSFSLGSFPSPATAGQSNLVTITARDAFGNVAVGYTGKAAINSSDIIAGLPAAYLFTTADAGVKQLPVILKTAGVQSITAKDVATPSITGSQENIQVVGSVAKSIALTGYPATTKAGVANSFTIAAKDEFGNVASGYSGTVSFSSSDPQVGLPENYTFTAADNSTKTFQASLKTVGTQSLTATDTVNSALTSTQSSIQVTPGVATQLFLTPFPSPTVAGLAQPITATLKDAFGNLATDYTGTVRFTSSDLLAGLPADYTFTSADQGTKTFSITLKTAGSQSVSLADLGNPSVSLTQSGITVNAGPATTFSLSGLPSTVKAAVTTGFTVRASDAFGNPATSYVGTVKFTSSDSRATLPANTTFTAADKGVRTFTDTKFTLVDKTVSLTATDLGNAKLVGTAQTQVLRNYTSRHTLVGYQQTGVSAETFENLPVKFFDQTSNVPLFTATPYADAQVFGGGRVTTADFNGDGRADLVVGTGPGFSTRVIVIDGYTEQQVFAIEPFEASFKGGVYVAAGDLDGDGVPELVITPDEGGGPRVRVFDGRNFSARDDFFGIDDKSFRGGARAAIGDVNGDGAGDLIVAAGFGGGPRIAGYDGTSVGSSIKRKVFGDFFAFEQSLRNGSFVTVGDLNGDGFAELIAGGGPGGAPRVLALNGRSLLTNVQQPVVDFFAGNTESRGGVRLTVKDLDNDSQADLVVGAGTGDGSNVTSYLGKNLASGNTSANFEFDAFDDLASGVFVG